jgi:hypothetical protein
VGSPCNGRAGKRRPVNVYSLLHDYSEEFEAIFVIATDIDLAEDFFDRVGEETGSRVSRLRVATGGRNGSKCVFAQDPEGELESRL